MSMEANKTAIQAYAEAFSRGDFERVAALCTPDVEVQGVLGKGGLDVAMPIWRSLHEAFGIHLSIEEIIAEGDVVAVRFVETGTFRAPFRGMEPTGKSYQLVAMEWFHMRDGKIAARWGARDSASMMRQVEAS
jgi:steroid delta-isomerase-like uncharacterized protein